MIYEDADIFIAWEESEIPWVKIFTQEPYRELSECPEALYEKVCDVSRLVERTMIDYFKPDKINRASFGNYLPRVHVHIMARFKADSFFPEPMWGKRQRNATLELPDFALFEAALKEALRKRGYNEVR